jgi:hypothetical protein
MSEAYNTGFLLAIQTLIGIEIKIISHNRFNFHVFAYMIISGFI